jgi:hypothetical protein
VFVVEHGLAVIEAFVTAFDWSSRAVPIGVGKVISLPTHVVSRYHTARGDRARGQSA